MENSNQNIKYRQARKRVRELKGFYIHLLVYVLVNAMIILMKFMKNGFYELDWGSLGYLGFWGIGLLVHGASVFLPGLLLGREWEEKKIRQIMEKNKKTG